MSKVDNIFLSQTGIFNKKSEIAQHNIANSNVPGSSKIEVKVVSDPYLGSTISEINSTLNPMLARDAVKLEAAVQGNEEATQLMEKISQFLGSPQLSGGDLSGKLSGSIENFARSLKDLTLTAGTLGDMKMESAYKDAENLVSTINDIGNKLIDLRVDADSQIYEKVQKLNQEIQNIRDLSEKLPLLKDSPIEYSTAQDKIVAGMKEISKYIEVEASTDSKGNFLLQTASGVTLIQHGMNYEVKFEHTANKNAYLDPTHRFSSLYVLNKNNPDTPAFRLQLVSEGESENTVSKLKNGELATLFEFRDKIIPKISQSLDQYTGVMAKKINDAYANSTETNGFQKITSRPGLSPSQPVASTAGTFKILILDDQGKGANTVFDVNVDTSTVMYDTSPFNTNTIVSKINDTGDLNASLDTDGRLVIESTNPNQRFVILNDTAKFVTDGQGFNQFFGFQSVFDFQSGMHHNSNNSKNAAVALKLHDSITAKRGFNTAELDYKSGTDYSIARTNNVANLTEAIDENVTIDGNDVISRYSGSLSGYGKHAILALKEKRDDYTAKAENSKLELESIEQKIAEESGINVNDEMLSAMMMKRLYDASMKAWGMANELFFKFLDSIVVR